MTSPRLVNGSLGIVQGFETHGQTNLHTVQGAAVEQNEKGTVVTEGLRSPLAPQMRYPVVLFSNGQQKLCTPVSFQVLNSKGEVEATRDQV
jgi:hypothetical protein